MNQKDIQFCYKVTNQIYNMSIARPFKVDDEDDPKYCETIMYPMDLETVLYRLNNEYYGNFTKWYNDMNKIWENAQIFYPKNSIKYQLSLELQQVFQRKCSNKMESHSDFELWIKNMKKINSSLQKFIQAVQEKQNKLNENDISSIDSTIDFFL